MRVLETGMPITYRNSMADLSLQQRRRSLASSALGLGWERAVVALLLTRAQESTQTIRLPGCGRRNLSLSERHKRRYLLSNISQVR